MQVGGPWGPRVQVGVPGSQCAGKGAMGFQCAGGSPRASIWRYYGYGVTVCKFESHVQVKVPWGPSVVVSPSPIGNISVSWGLNVQEGVTGSEVQMDSFEASSVI